MTLSPRFSAYAFGGIFLAVAMFFGSTAEACISCNYTPEVVNTPVPGQAKRPAKSRAAVGKAQPTQKRVVKTRPPAEPADTPKEAEAPKAAETPTETAKETTTETAPVESQDDTAASGSATAALNGHEAARTEEPPPPGAVGCKKFSAAIGATITVPCE
jgi:hypothetical protein